LSGPEGVPDGQIDATHDRQIIGDPNPDYFGGWTNNFSYKGFELFVFMNWSVGNDIFSYDKFQAITPTGGGNVWSVLKDRWTPENPSNEYPVATTNRANVVTDQMIQDGSYLRIKTLSLAYTFPTLNAKHIGNLRVYISGQNLFTSTNYVGFNPEVSMRGASNLEIGEDLGVYPIAKTYMLGVTLDLR
jgi:hypothetical protein